MAGGPSTASPVGSARSAASGPYGESIGRGARVGVALGLAAAGGDRRGRRVGGPGAARVLGGRLGRVPGGAHLGQSAACGRAGRGGRVRTAGGGRRGSGRAARPGRCPTAPTATGASGRCRRGRRGWSGRAGRRWRRRATARPPGRGRATVVAGARAGPGGAGAEGAGQGPAGSQVVGVEADGRGARPPQQHRPDRADGGGEAGRVGGRAGGGAQRVRDRAGPAVRGAGESRTRSVPSGAANATRRSVRATRRAPPTPISARALLGLLGAGRVGVEHGEAVGRLARAALDGRASPRRRRPSRSRNRPAAALGGWTGVGTAPISVVATRSERQVSR